MGQLVRDVHTSALKLVENKSDLSPANKTYKRVSIPYVENRHCLGYLEGPAASLIKDTRNGRGYVLKLWRNIEKSEDFLEGMQCATIIGELDHPEERIDYSLTKGAVVLTDWEIREDEGILWCRFAILDNDEGRTLLSYVKFGTVLGVSSRGLGDEIMVDGRNIIDPDTYEFYCFDVVAFPAAAVARQTFKEADEIKAECVHKAFSDRVITETNNINNIEDLNKLKEVVESTNVADKAALVETISNKLSSLSESADDQRNACDEPANDDENEELKAQIADKDSEIENLKELLRKQSEDASYFRKAFQGMALEKEQAETAVDDSLQSISEMNNEYESLRSKYNQECSTLIESLNFRMRAYEKIKARNELLQKENQKLSDQNQIIKNSLTESQDKLKAESNRADQLMEYNKQLSQKLESVKKSNLKALKESKSNEQTSKRLIENYEDKIKSSQETSKMLEESLHMMEQRLEDLSSSSKLQESKICSILEKYLETKCAAYNLKIEAVKAQMPDKYNESDIDNAVKTLADRQRRYDNMPMDIPSRTARVVEHKVRSNLEYNSSNFVKQALLRGN